MDLMDVVKQYFEPRAALVTAVVTVGLIYLRSRRRHLRTKLAGPPAKSWLFGVSKELFDSPDPPSMHGNWVKQFGLVYQIPVAFGEKSIVLCDPKALAGFFAKDTFTFQQPAATRKLFSKNFGQNVLASEMDDHKRQRRALSSGFSISAIRDLVPVFYNSVHSTKAVWDSIMQRSGTDSARIDVQHWMNNISLDSIGVGGFSHEFGSTTGKTSEVAEHFEALGSSPPSIALMLRFVLAPIAPLLMKLPTKRGKTMKALSASFREIAKQLMERARLEKVGEDKTDKSILSVLMRSETASSNVQMDEDEIVAQINLFMIAGYETTSIAMTWALIELSRHQDVQQKLREEITNISSDGLTYEQLASELPYLNAVALETLRLHPSLPEINREAQEDEILPLSEPIVDINGQTLSELLVSQGTKVRIPLATINRLEALWGPDSNEFKPERWLDEGVSKAKASELQGYHHLLTFADGPRTCLGKLFASTEFKVVLSVLVRNYRFELPDGPKTEIGRHRALLPRPKVVGEEGSRVPLIVTRVE